LEGARDAVRHRLYKQGHKGTGSHDSMRLRQRNIAGSQARKARTNVDELKSQLAQQRSADAQTHLRGFLFAGGLAASSRSSG
jgi:hypothetical protein